MTSGNFSSFPLDQIIVNREERQRKELTNIDSLADSISKAGLINPIVVTKATQTLVAGERRLTACQQLGWTHIPVQWAEDLSADELELIELEENVKRVSLFWKDQCSAIRNYHDIKTYQDAEWTMKDTAAALGLCGEEVSDGIVVQEALDSGDPLVNEADKYSVARGITERKASRAKEANVDAIDKLLRTPKVSVSAISRTNEQEEHTTYQEAVEPEPGYPLLHADFCEWAEGYDGLPFNFLHCDFPYGINAGKHHGGAADKFGGYDDSEDVYWKLLEEIALRMDTLVAPSAHMMFWFSMEYYHETHRALTNAGWTVNKFPLIWFRSDNSGIMPDPKRGGRRTYETALHCTRGDRMVVKPVSMLHPNPNTKEIHMSEKPRPMLRHFFRMFVDETTRMLDPTCGSANAVIEAQDAGAAEVLGIERDETFYKDAVRNYSRFISGERD